MMLRSRKGQAAGAAVLLAIIAGLLIMFVVLVPPKERAELLDETYSDDDTVLEIGNLLKESPGRVDYLEYQEIEHPLPVINIYTKTESKVLAERNVAYIKNGLFSEENSVFRFSFRDLENTEDLLLAFSVKDAQGRLMVDLNGEEIFNSEITTRNVDPIKLPKDLLHDDNNELVFRISSPGIAFWVTNEMTLERIQIVGDVTSTDVQTSRNTFLISETEKTNLEKMVLKFQPTCNFVGTGKLLVTVNGETIYHALPDCDLEMIPIEFSSNLVNLGENEIVFYTEKGNYLLSHVVVKSILQDVELLYPTYYFELSMEQYGQVLDEDLELELEMDFVDVITVKEGEIVFNGHIKSFSTKESSLTVDLSRDAELGTNSLKIRPKKTLDLRQITVDLES